MYKHIFGPVPSRRLGVSLGVDLVNSKSCNMNCVFCECGGTTNFTIRRQRFKDPNEITREIADVIKKVTPDYITFSGAGEPTLSTDMGYIINWIHEHTSCKVCVITNSLLLADEKVVEEIKNADLIIPTINSTDNEIFRKINRAGVGNIESIKIGLRNLSAVYKGQVYLETFIIEGINDSDAHTDAMAEFLKTIKFTKLQLNSLDRGGAESWVMPASPQILNHIKNRYIQNGITNVEIVGNIKDIVNKLEINEELLSNMKSKRNYNQSELEKIYKIK